MISNYNTKFKEKQMRDILNLLDNVVTESVGLANRKPGTLFANPQGDELVFQGVKFYPEGGGAYATPEEWTATLNQVCQQLGISPSIIQWVDGKGNAVAAPNNQKGGFGIAEFNSPAGQRHFLARYLRAISPIPIENEISNKLPGGYRLQTDVAKKEAAGFKPTDVLGGNLNNLSPADILAGIQAKFGIDSDEANATEIFMSTTTYPIRMPLGNMNFTAFTNYFCEMLQPMALVLGHKTIGEAQKAEQDWLSQGGYASCKITFGGSKIGGLTDSTLINSAGQVMGLSTKAEDGAKASAKNLMDKVAEMKSDPNGQKLLSKYAKEISLIEVVTSGSTPGVLGTAVLAKLITAEERDQIMDIRKLPPGSEVIGQKLLSKNLEKKYADRLQRVKDLNAVIPFFHIRAVLANEVADWVNTTTNFGKAAAAILNWGAFIQVKTHAKQSGSEIVMDQFEVIYPSEAVTNVELSAGKTFYSTGSKGNFTFVILYNGATEIKDAGDDNAEVPADATPAKDSTADLDRVTKKRSGVTARNRGLEEEERFSKAALGRDYQR
jgi:hypothetical protein